MPADDWRIANTLSLLGEAIAGQGRYAEAEPLLLAGNEGMVASHGDGPLPQPDWIAVSFTRLIDL